MKNENNTLDEFDKLYNIDSSNLQFLENINSTHLVEMTKLRRHETGLSVDIWVDEDRILTKFEHGKLIIFQGNSKNPKSHKLIPLTISKHPKVPVSDVQYDLSPEDFNKIKLFINKNLEYLKKLGDVNFGITDFAKVMRKV